MIPIRVGLTSAALATTLLLWGLTVVSGLGPGGVAVGVTCIALLSAAVVRWATTSYRTVLSPADLLTIARGGVGCCAAALVVDSAVAESATAVVASLAGAALALDAVDGWTARLTGTVSAFGARLDLEADAFLILVLSVACSRTAGAWTLAFGAARYLFALGGRPWLWLGAELPYRYWRKVVTGSCGVALTVAFALPGPATQVALAGALSLLVESFARDIVWLWRRRLRTSAQDRDRTRAPAELVLAQTAQGHAPSDDARGPSPGDASTASHPVKRLTRCRFARFPA